MAAVQDRQHLAIQRHKETTASSARLLPQAEVKADQPPKTAAQAGPAVAVAGFTRASATAQPEQQTRVTPVVTDTPQPTIPAAVEAEQEEQAEQEPPTTAELVEQAFQVP